MALLLPADFKGFHLIASDCFDEAEIQLFINKYEPLYLKWLMGAALYALYVADLIANVPQTPPYTTIYNPLCEDDPNCLSGCTRYNLWNCDGDCAGTCKGCEPIKISDGIKEMLKGFIYWRYVRSQKYINTVVGNVVNKNENSREAVAAEISSESNKRYNDAIDSYCTIQWYICDNETDFPTFNGKRLRKIFFGGAF